MPTTEARGVAIFFWLSSCSPFRPTIHTKAQPRTRNGRETDTRTHSHEREPSREQYLFTAGAIAIAVIRAEGVIEKGVRKIEAKLYRPRMDRADAAAAAATAAAATAAGGA